MNYVTQDFHSAKGYLVEVLTPKNINLDGDEETSIQISTSQALDAIQLALEDGVRHGKASFNAGFETGRRQILSGLSDELQAEVLGAIDLDTMKAMDEFDEGKPVHLICRRCGTNVMSEGDTRCPMCDEPTLPSE